MLNDANVTKAVRFNDTEVGSRRACSRYAVCDLRLLVWLRFRLESFAPHCQLRNKRRSFSGAVGRVMKSAPCRGVDNGVDGDEKKICIL